MNSCEYRSILESNVEAVCLTVKAWPNVLRTSTAVNLQQEWLEKQRIGVQWFCCGSTLRDLGIAINMIN